MYLFELHSQREEVNATRKWQNERIRLLSNNNIYNRIFSTLENWIALTAIT